MSYSRANVSNAEMFNRSINMTQDLMAFTGRVNTQQKICVQLFDKLRGTALFLVKLLGNIDDSDEIKQLMHIIEEIYLEIDKSIIESKSIVEELESKYMYTRLRLLF